MTPRRKPKTDNLLDHKKASVAIHRNGLSIEVGDIPASESGRVASALLDAMRELVKAGYDELIHDAGGVHSGALGEVPDEVYEEAEANPSITDKRVGFTQG